MPLKPIPELLASARDRGYALGYFESWNLESLQGVIDAAERTRSPIIVGFNGDFLTRPGRVATERIKWHAALGRAAAETARVPCGLNFNECPRDRFVKQAVSAGFNLVMLADHDAPYENYVQRVAGLSKFAHQRGAAIEAELGELPSGSSGKVVAGHSSLTDPRLVARFVAATGIDLLSISVGNVHVLIDGEQPLDLERLAQIRRRVDVPLGLHGGTGIPAASLKEAIHMGVAKVTYGTYLKQRYLAAVRKALDSGEINPHELLGMGRPHDVLIAGRVAVREAVLERIDLLGCCGKA